MDSDLVAERLVPRQSLPRQGADQALLRIAAAAVFVLAMLYAYLVYNYDIPSAHFRRLQGAHRRDVSVTYAPHQKIQAAAYVLGVVLAAAVLTHTFGPGGGAGGGAGGGGGRCNQPPPGWDPENAGRYSLRDWMQDLDRPRPSPAVRIGDHAAR